MQPFTSKELYMMNGGQKLYIYKDGVGDIYNATATGEAQWARDVVDRAFKQNSNRRKWYNIAVCYR